MRRARRGQALVEFTLVLPTFMLTGLLFIQLCLLGVRWWELNSATSAVARQAAAYNGETRAVDDAALRIAAANGLGPDRLWAEIDTDAGRGRAHRVDLARGADAPPSAGYGGDVTAHLTYEAPLLFGLFGTAVPLSASFSQESIGAYGELAP